MGLLTIKTFPSYLVLYDHEYELGLGMKIIITYWRSDHDHTYQVQFSRAFQLLVHVLVRNRE